MWDEDFESGLANIHTTEVVEENSVAFRQITSDVNRPLKKQIKRQLDDIDKDDYVDLNEAFLKRKSIKTEKQMQRMWGVVDAVKIKFSKGDSVW